MILTWAFSAAAATFGDFEVLNQLPGFKQLGTIDQAASEEGAIVTVMNIVLKIIRALVIAIGLIVVVLGGYRYMTAGGDPNRVGDAKKWILAGLGGILLAIVGQIVLDTISPQFSGDIIPPKKIELPEPEPQIPFDPFMPQ